MNWVVKTSGFLEWDLNDTVGTILDRMCCCSYLDVCEETEATYYKTRATTVPIEWLTEDEPIETIFISTNVESDLEPTHTSAKSRNKILPPPAIFKESMSFETITTVPMNISSFESSTAGEECGAEVEYWSQEMQYLSDDESCNTDIAIHSKFWFGIPPHNFQLEEDRDKTERHTQFQRETIWSGKKLLSCCGEGMLLRKQVQNEGIIYRA